MEMAWVLGIVCSDGHLGKSSNNGGRLNIGMQDKDVLEKIKKVMNSEHPIRKKDFSKYKYGTWYWFLDIGSKEIYQDLKKLGLTENKSKTLKFPNVPPRLLSHFVRGYFEGDGTILKHGKKKRLSITSSKEFIKKLSQILLSLGFGNFTGQIGGSYFLTSYTSNDIFPWIYKNHKGLFMNRKFNLVY